MDAEVKIRDYDTVNDAQYIIFSWSKFVFYGKFKKLIKNPKEKEKWFRDKTCQIYSILNSSVVKVACLKGSEYVIAGYVVAEPTTPPSVIWMCIKKEYQNQGIDTLLLKSIDRGQNGKT